jgi:transcriptional regulator with XRE-family HTH domain
VSDRFPNAIDRHVASRVLLRRQEAGLTQQMVADALGVTFQQFQKYERAINRISAGTLYQLSLTLEVPWDTSSRGGAVTEKSPDSAKLLCRISIIPPALQSCETLPEGWPCLSMDSAQIGAVKVSSHCWFVSSTTWVERSPISGCLQSSGASLTMSTAGTYCANICWCSGKYCLQTKRPLSSRQSMMSGTRFARSQKIRAILRGQEKQRRVAFGEKRATWRIAAGLTQTAVAKRSGMNSSYLSHLESGRRNPTLATLERLAKILNVAPGSFL